ncbi:MAG: hypothetical protein LBG44_00485 [Gemmatimonadota bacterium]|jgi:hypothetical protein|nr:hypothetical protein [Gemmatimonadota bacterium]
MHLNREDIARLVDEPMNNAEASHLAKCTKCAAELEEMRQLTTSLRELRNPEMPDLVRARIARAIREEPLTTPDQEPLNSGTFGLHNTAGGPGDSNHPRPPTGNPSLFINAGWLRVAAGLALFVFGGAVGTFVVAPRITVDAGVALASTGTRASGPADPADPASDEETLALTRAESDYLDALSRYARTRYENDGSDPVNRLAALEGIVLTTRSALREAPADPVINGYHLTALSQRDELLRQIQADTGDEWF